MKNITRMMMTTNVSNPPPMYMMNLPWLRWTKVFPWSSQQFRDTKTKKADVIKHPKVFHHVGLLFNQPPGMAGLLLV
jgi:hypothetical protein